MKDSLRTGISFGLTSAVITTLGLMVGLHSGTDPKIVVLTGILIEGHAKQLTLQIKWHKNISETFLTDRFSFNTAT